MYRRSEGADPRRSVFALHSSRPGYERLHAVTEGCPAGNWNRFAKRYQFQLECGHRLTLIVVDDCVNMADHEPYPLYQLWPCVSEAYLRERVASGGLGDDLTREVLGLYFEEVDRRAATAPEPKEYYTYRSYVGGGEYAYWLYRNPRDGGRRYYSVREVCEEFPRPCCEDDAGVSPLVRRNGEAVVLQVILGAASVEREGERYSRWESFSEGYLRAYLQTQEFDDLTRELLFRKLRMRDSDECEAGPADSAAETAAACAAACAADSAAETAAAGAAESADAAEEHPLQPEAVRLRRACKRVLGAGIGRRVYRGEQAAPCAARVDEVVDELQGALEAFRRMREASRQPADAGYDSDCMIVEPGA